MVFFELFFGGNNFQEKAKHKSVSLNKKAKSTSTHDETTTKEHKSTSEESSSPTPKSTRPTLTATDKNKPTVAAFTSESPPAATPTSGVANVNALNNSNNTQSTGMSASGIIGITFVVIIAVGIVGLFVRRKMVAGRARNSTNSDDKEWNAGSQDHADMRSVSQKTNSGFNDDVPLIDGNSKRPPSTTSPHAPTTSGSPPFSSTSMNNNDTYHSPPVAYLNNPNINNNEASLPQGWLKDPPISNNKSPYYQEPNLNSNNKSPYYQEPNLNSNNKSPYYQEPNLNSSQNPVIASTQVHSSPSSPNGDRASVTSSTLDVDDSFSAIPLDDDAAVPQTSGMSTVPQIPPLSLKGNKKDLVKSADQEDGAIISERKDDTPHLRPESRPLGDLDDILSEFTFLDSGSHNISRIVDNKPAIINPNLTTSKIPSPVAMQQSHLSPSQPSPPSPIFVNNGASENSGNVFSETEAANDADKNSSQSSPVVAGFVTTNKATMQVESVPPTSVETSTKSAAITGFVNANKSTIQVGNVDSINDEGDTVGAATTAQTDSTQQSAAISGFVTANKSSIQVEDVADTVTQPDKSVTPMFDVERDTVSAVTATSGFVTANKSSIQVEDVTNTPPAKPVTPMFDIEGIKKHAEKIRSMKTTTGPNKNEKTDSPSRVNEEVNSNSAINHKSVDSSILPSISVTPYDEHSKESPIVKSPIQFSEISINQSSLELDDDVASLESPETDLTLEKPEVEDETKENSEDIQMSPAEDQVITSSRPTSTLTDKHASITSSNTDPKTYRSPTLSMFSLYDYEDRSSVSYTGGVTIFDGKTNEEDSEESLR